jgi:diphthine-ammonia ligase
MCGIIGVYNNKHAGEHVKKGLEALKARGRDGYGITDGVNSHYSKRISSLPTVSSDNVLGHCLLSIVGRVHQPIQNSFVANCEIYNWKGLNRKYHFKKENDAEVLFMILKKGLKTLSEVDGVYAFAYWKGKEVVLGRDLIGEKPLWYSHSDGFAFASEKKALEGLGYLDVMELNPRKFLRYSIDEDRLELINRPFFSITPELTGNLENSVKELLEDSVKKRIPEKRFGLLFSGGIDSTVLATLFKKLGCRFTCYTAACIQKNAKLPEDLVSAKEVAKALGLKLKVIAVPVERVPRLLKKIVPLVEDSNVTKVAVALPIFVACQQAHKDGCKVVFSGLGSEEIFAGYQRHRNSLNINQECLSGILKIYERDLYRDDVISMHHTLELRLPFLDTTLVGYALRIPAILKLGAERDKIVLRNIARRIGIPEKFSERKKRAAQYGSNFLKAIDKLARRDGFKTKSAYLRTFYPKHNLRLGVLFSSGKDSVYALYVMQRQNYEISCLVTMVSQNPDSFMFHSPVHLARLQAEAMGLPIIEQPTHGKKERELRDLEKALLKAKEMYSIEGVVTGAIFSNYQRERIERVCDNLGLKIFSPLWHLNQESEMREILDNGFKFIIAKIAAEGLNKEWLGRLIAQEDIMKLVELNKRVGINIAFEGGEAETLVIDGPIFKKKIVIKQAEKVMENSCTGIYRITKAELQ